IATGRAWVDLYAGSGGVTTGIERFANGYVVDAANHNPVAIKLHRKNHARTRHHLCDLLKADPRRFERTPFLWLSPAAHRWAPANDKGIFTEQMDMFDQRVVNESVDAARATLIDALRMVHGLLPVVFICENVSKLRRWPGYDWWRESLAAIGADRMGH